MNHKRYVLDYGNLPCISIVRDLMIDIQGI